MCTGPVKRAGRSKVDCRRNDLTGDDELENSGIPLYPQSCSLYTGYYSLDGNISTYPTSYVIAVVPVWRFKSSKTETTSAPTNDVSREHIIESDPYPLPRLKITTGPLPSNSPLSNRSISAWPPNFSWLGPSFWAWVRS